MKTIFGDQSNLANTSINDQKLEKTVREKAPAAYRNGHIFCGRIGKYPWWPCMVVKPPNDENLYEGKCFVRYFGRQNEVSWLGSSGIINVNSQERLNYELNNNYSKKANKKVSSRYKEELHDAWDEVSDALSMTPEERLHKFDVNYSVIESKMKGNNKYKSRPKLKAIRTIKTEVPRPIEKKKKEKICTYAFRELDMPSSSLFSHSKCCRYCLISDKTTLKCTNNCGNGFHLTCVNQLKTQSEITVDDGNKCIECSLDYRKCCACSKEISKDDEDVLTCSKGACNRLYHRSCLETGSMLEMTRKTLFDKVICPRHLCHRCELIEENPKFKCSKLVHCLMCAGTYHNGDWCVPAGSIELSKSEIICPRHLPVKGNTLPYLPPFIGRINSELRTEIYGDFIPKLNDIALIKPNKSNYKAVNINWCFTCGKDGKLICCDSCPSAFHLDCVNVVTVPEHYYCADCTNSKYHTYGEIIWIKFGVYRWWPGQIMHPEMIPDNIDNITHNVGDFVTQFFGTHEYHWLDKTRIFAFEEGDKHNLKGKLSIAFEKNFQMALKEAEIGFLERQSHWNSAPSDGLQKSRVYKQIKINKPYGNVKKSKKLNLPAIPKCDCKYLCPENTCNINSDCINIQLKYECRQDLCGLKERCQNQNFVQRNYPKQEVFCSAKCGWGLKTMEPIEKHQFVNEYVGEIIDSKEAERRREWAKENSITDFYFMELDNSRIIDAREYSNLSRFMNHSCDPNLFAEKWIVLDDQRIGLFALRDIQAGEELTFNYNLYTKSPSLLPCLCGSTNCSRFLGEQPKKITKDKVLTSKPMKKRPRLSVAKKRLLDIDTAESISKESMSNSISTVSLNTIKSVDKQCFRCSGTCNENIDMSCSMELCTKIYHSSCIDLPRDYDAGPQWVCPWHFCDTCGILASHTCELCSRSSCPKHFNPDIFNKMFSPNEGICINHDDD